MQSDAEKKTFLKVKMSTLKKLMKISLRRFVVFKYLTIKWFFININIFVNGSLEKKIFSQV